MKLKLVLFIIGCIFGLTACQPAQPVCGENTIRYVDSVQQLPALADSPAGLQKNPDEIEIKGKMIQFDEVISGPLCNNHLSGKVYVTCDVEIVAWETAPNFFDGCDFFVEPGSQIYVASHNNQVYYKGCDSCHKSSE